MDNKSQRLIQYLPFSTIMILSTCLNFSWFVLLHVIIGNNYPNFSFTIRFTNEVFGPGYKLWADECKHFRSKYILVAELL